MLPVIEQFDGFFAEHSIAYTKADVEERFEEADLLPVIGAFDGLICGDDRITDKVLDAAVNLKVISKWGTGIDSIDSAAAADRGIRVCRTPDAFTDPVADSVMGYVLGFVRRLPEMDGEMKSGNWEKIPGRALNECTLGIIGVGKIGQAIARRARSFGMHTLGNDPAPIDTHFLKETGMEMVDKLDLCQRSDFVSVNCDLNPTSEHLMGAEEFKSMKDSAVFLNLARGPVMDEGALVAALKTKSIAGAALDVFEFEPLPKNSPLRAMSNVMLAPHNSNSSPKAWERVHRSTLDQLLAGLKSASKQTDS